VRLFHFSDDPNIRVFEPRSVRVSSERPTGREWLNGPLVWAIDELHQPMYLFPRDCPRVLCWPTPATTPEDYQRWWGERSSQVVAHIEWSWLDRLQNGILHRYELPQAEFINLHDAGMWVSRMAVTSIKVETLHDLPAELRGQGVELRVIESLVSLKELWKTSLHVSGIRLRNARDWNSQGQVTG
jgi:uncharacterized protein DUF6886